MRVLDSLQVTGSLSIQGTDVMNEIKEKYENALNAGAYVKDVHKLSSDDLSEVLDSDKNFNVFLLGSINKNGDEGNEKLVRLDLPIGYYQNTSAEVSGNIRKRIEGDFGLSYTSTGTLIRMNTTVSGKSYFDGQTLVGGKASLLNKNDIRCLNYIIGDTIKDSNRGNDYNHVLMYGQNIYSILRAKDVYETAINITNCYGRNSILLDNTKCANTQYSSDDKHLIKLLPNSQGQGEYILGGLKGLVLDTQSQYGIELTGHKGWTKTGSPSQAAIYIHNHGCGILIKNPANSGSDTAAYAIYATGNSYLTAIGADTVVANDITKRSDERIKDNFSEIDKYDKLFDSLHPYEYNFKDKGNKKNLGFKAQDVLKSLVNIGISEEDTNIVVKKKLFGEEREKYGLDEIYALSYDDFIPLLVRQVQLLKKEIIELKSK